MTLGPPRFLPGTRINDLTLGTAGVLLGGVWALRSGVPAGRELAEHAANVLLAEAEQEPTGTNWRYVSLRWRTDPATEMPNLSHGLAGIAMALAVAGTELDRPDLVAAARSGAEHLVSLGDASGEGFVVPRYVPAYPDEPDLVSFGWCHGAAGTSLLFAALDAGGRRRGGGGGAVVVAAALPAQRPHVRHPGSVAAGLLGQRRAVLRHRGSRRRPPRRLGAVGT